MCCLLLSSAASRRTHPFTFLSLRAFRSCEAIEPSVSLSTETLVSKHTATYVCTYRYIHTNVHPHRQTNRQSTQTDLRPHNSLLARDSRRSRWSNFSLEDATNQQINNHNNKQTDAHNTTASFTSMNLSHTCSPFLPGSPERP